MKLAVAAIALGLAAADRRAPQETLRLSPRSDVGVEHSWSFVHEIRMRELVTQRGTDEPRRQQLPLHLHTEQSLRIVDEWRAPDDAPHSIRRRYEEASGRIEARNLNDIEAVGPGFSLRSPLVGKSVVFVESAAGADGFGRHYDADEAPEPILPRLGPPARLARLLPAGPVELGAVWPVEPAALEDLIAPGGFLAWRGDEEADPQLMRAFLAGVGGNLHLGFDSAPSGEAEAMLLTVAVEDGRRLGVVRITFSIGLVSDRTDFTEERLLDEEAASGVEMLGATLAVDLEGSVDLRWDLDAGRALGAELRAEEDVRISIRARPAGGTELTQSMRMSGSFAVDMTAKQVPLSPPPGPR